MDYYDMEPNQKFDDVHYFDVEMPTVWEVWDSCMYPSIAQITQYLSTYIIWNIAFRVTSQTVGISRRFQHLTSIVCGMALLYFTLGLDSLYSLGFTTITYLLYLTITSMNLKFYGKTLTFFCLTSLTIGEILDTDVSTWHRMRGTQMIAAMKIISVGFDIDRNKIKGSLDFFEFWGYILCPGNVVMGPWAAYNDYLNIYHRPKWSFKWALQVVANALLAVFFLLASNCLVSSFISDFNFKWGAAYKAALSYRCSHYFVCFMSQCTMLMAGFTTPKSTKREKPPALGYLITKPWIIEIPRSLVDVVVYWNLSMHHWLKSYIFLQIKPYGIFKAVLATYIISSLLHGINIQLAAVLLTLGFATFVEFKLRKKISDVFDACILAHPCDKATCSHKHKSDNFWVIAFNFGFGVVAVIHLAYLGVMFEGPVEDQGLTYSFQHILDRWGALNFSTHWLILITYLVHVCI